MTQRMMSRTNLDEWIPAVDSFFNDVMVNADDAVLRQNRLQLLAEVRELFLRGWDLSRIVVEGEKQS